MKTYYFLLFAFLSIEFINSGTIVPINFHSSFMNNLFVNKVTLTFKLETPLT